MNINPKRLMFKIMTTHFIAKGSGIKERIISVVIIGKTGH